MAWLQMDKFPPEIATEGFLCDTAGKVQGILMAQLPGRREEISVHSLFQAQESETEIIWFPERSHDLLSLLLKVAESVTKK